MIYADEARVLARERGRFGGHAREVKGETADRCVLERAALNRGRASGLSEPMPTMATRMQYRAVHGGVDDPVGWWPARRPGR